MIAFAHYLSRPYVLVLLAGALHPSPLRRQLDVPVLALPLGRDRTLLDAWLDTIANTSAPIARLIIVVSSSKDAETMRDLVHERKQDTGNAEEGSAGNGRHAPGAVPACDVEVMIDPAQWRGPAGLLRDIATSPGSIKSTEDGDSRTPGFAKDTLFACAEAAVLPPHTLDPLLVRRADPTLAGVIGAVQESSEQQPARRIASSNLRPAGVYAFTADAILSIPPIGFHDIKEQLLPSLYRAGLRVPVVPLCREVVRIRDLDSYLLGIRRSLGHAHAVSRSHKAGVSDAAVLSGPCIVQDDVVVEDGAVIHESVLMQGARIGGGTVVARSVIGPGAFVGPRSVVRSAVVAQVARPIPKLKKSRHAVNRLFPLRTIASDESRR